MTEKISISVTVPKALAASANQFLRALAFPTQNKDGKYGPPPCITVKRSSSKADYVVEQLKFRELGISPDGPPTATVIEVVAIPIK